MHPRITHALKLAAAAIAAVGALAFVQPAAQAGPLLNTECNGSGFGNQALGAQTTFDAGTYYCAGSYKFYNQPDGNFVVYNGSGSHVWASETDTHLPDNLFMNPNGDFGFINGIWHTNTGGHPDAYICFQRDGNVVVYAHGGNCSGTVLWASNS